MRECSIAFLAAAVAVATGCQSAPATPPAPPFQIVEATIPEINAWVVIAPDDSVTIRIGQTELGQGVWTACALMIAEELQCDWNKVRGEYASANRDAREKAPEWTLKNPAGKEAATNPYGGGGEGDLPTTNETISWTGVYRRLSTHRSGSVKMNMYYFQMAGAEARERLLLAAAEELRARIKGQSPIITREQATMLGRYYWYDHSRATALGYVPRPARAAIADAIAWLSAGSHIARETRAGMHLHADVFAARLELERREQEFSSRTLVHAV